MNIKKNLPALMVASILLCACSHNVLPSLRPSPPADVMQPVEGDFLAEMETAITQSTTPPYNGINSLWLYDFAGRAEKTRLQLNAAQSFITKSQVFVK